MAALAPPVAELPPMIIVVVPPVLIEALNEIENDFIVEVLDSGIDARRKTRFLVMEYVQGSDLQTVIEREGALAPALVVDCLAQLSHALEAIHAKGIVHRDLKPANLVLRTRSDQSPEVKLLDFGVSKFVRESSLGKTTVVAGTVGYMAPEQIAGADVDRRTDIFALGQVAYTLLYGRPLAAESAERFRPQSTFDATQFSRWFQKATANDKRQRFATASDAMTNLRVALATQRRVRRPVWPLAVAGGVVIGIVVGRFLWVPQRPSPTEPAASSAPMTTAPNAAVVARAAPAALAVAADAIGSIQTPPNRDQHAVAPPVPSNRQAPNVSTQKNKASVHHNDAVPKSADLPSDTF